MCTRPKANEAEIGFDAIADVQPGGHFFSTQHTMDRYKTAFYEPIVADLNNFGTWTESGSRTSTDRAVDVWQTILRDFKPPAGAADAAERVRPYIEKATRAGGAPPLD